MADVAAELLGKAAVDSIPWWHAAIKRQIPANQTQKWDKRVDESIQSVRDSCPPDTMIQNGTPLADLEAFMRSVTGYEESRERMTELTQAKAAGASNYFLRRQIAAELAMQGREIQGMAVTTSTLMGKKQLACKAAGHLLPCSHCFPLASTPVLASTADDDNGNRTPTDTGSPIWRTWSEIADSSQPLILG